MDGNFPSSANLMQCGSSYEGLDLEGFMEINPQQQKHPIEFPNLFHADPMQGSMLQPMIPEDFPFTIGNEQTMFLADDVTELSFTEEGADDHNVAGTMGINPQQQNHPIGFSDLLHSDPMQGSMLQQMIPEDFPFMIGSEQTMFLAGDMTELSFTEEGADDHNIAGTMGINPQQQNHPIGFPDLLHSDPMQGSTLQPMIPEDFSFMTGSEQTMFLADDMKGPSFTEEGADDHNDASTMGINPQQQNHPIELPDLLHSDPMQESMLQPMIPEDFPFMIGSEQTMFLADDMTELGFTEEGADVHNTAGTMGINPQQQNHPIELPDLLHSDPMQGSMLQPMIPEDFPFTIGNEQTMFLADDVTEPSFNEEGADDHNDAGKGKKRSPLQRMKWTDVMIRLLITAVSYINEDILAAKRVQYINFPKNGKWKAISRVMVERGHLVSPQQCKDKFNDLNKKYKRLNDIFGRGTVCEFVENPSHLEAMNHIPVKAKEEVLKMLSTKHLHLKAMCSYHNRNRMYLPPDLELQRSLRIALTGKDNQDSYDMLRQMQDVIDQNTGGAELENHDKREENHVYGMQGQSSDNEVSPEGLTSNPFPKQSITHPYQLEEKNIQIEAEMLNIQAKRLQLEKERLELQTLNRKRDRKLKMMRMGNEKMKLENEREALELKQWEMSINRG